MSGLLSTAMASYLLSMAGQVTVVTAASLLLSLCFGRNPALRKCILASGLMCALASPLIAAIVRGSGLRWELIHSEWVPYATQPDGVSAQSALRSEQTTSSDRSDGNAHQTTGNSGTTAAVPPVGISSGDNPPDDTKMWRYAAMAFEAMTCVWLLGLVAGCWGIIRSWWKLRRVLNAAEPVRDVRVIRLCRDLQQFSAGGRVPSILKSKRITAPVLAGLRRPLIVLPAGHVDLFSTDDLRAVLLHEWAHIRAHDQWLLLIQQVVAAVYWPHPLIHVLNRRLALAREEVCDNCVLASMDRKSYGGVLLRLASLAPPAAGNPAFVGFMFHAWKLEDRIRGILDERRNMMTRVHGLSLSASMVLLAALVAAWASIGVMSDSPRAADTADEGGRSSFGPVTKLFVHNDAGELPLIDFDTGKVGGWPQGEAIESEEAALRWMAENGYDAVGEPGANIQGLVGVDMAVFPRSPRFDNEWDSPSAERMMRKLRTGKLGYPAVMFGKGKLPQTYYFKTREGGHGIMQIVGFGDEPRGVNVRYRLISSDAGKPSPNNEGRPVSQTISPADGQVMLDLETGQTFGPVIIGGDTDEPPAADLSFPAVGGKSLRWVVSLGMQTTELDGDDVWTMSIENVRRVLGDAPLRMTADEATAKRIVDDEDVLPKSFAFRTRDGAEGVLEISSVDAKTGQITLRYRISGKDNENDGDPRRRRSSRRQSRSSQKTPRSYRGELAAVRDARAVLQR